MISQLFGLKILPWLILANVIVVGGAAVTGYLKGHDAGYAERELEQLQTNAVIDQAAKAFDDAITAKLAKLRPINRHITQQVETLTREIPVYSGCVHDQRVYDNIIRAYGQEPKSVGGSLPSPTAAVGQELRTDDSSTNGSSHVVP